MKPSHIIVCFFTVIILTSCLGNRYSNKLIQRGEENFSQGKYREAITNFNNALIWNRKDPRAYFWLGKIYEQQNRIDFAIINYEKAFELQPHDKETVLRLTTLLISQKKYNTSLEVLEKGAMFHPLDLDIGYLLSLALTYSGKAEEALLLIDKIPTSSNNTRLTYAKALASDTLGMSDYALIYYRRAIELDSLNPLPYFEIIKHLKRRGETDLVKPYIDAAIKYFYDPFFLEEKLYVLMSEYRWNEAITTATTLFNLTARLDFLEKRARFFQIQGQTFNALNDYNFILSVDPTHLNSLYNRAVLQMRLGNEKSVYNDLTRFLELADTTTPSWQVERAREIMSNYIRNILPPKIKVTYPRCMDGKYLIYEHLEDSLLVRGYLFQKSFVKHITVNNFPARIYSFGWLKKVFVAKIPSPVNDSLTITAIDIYNNTTTWNFLVMENEDSSPEIIVLSPSVDSLGIIEQTDFSRTLRLKFLVADKNLLKTITINQQAVALKSAQRTFFADTPIAIPPFDTITITARDIFENVTHRKLYFPQNRTFHNISEKDILMIFFYPHNSLSIQSESLNSIDTLLSKISNAEIQNITPRSKPELERFLYFTLPELIKNGNYRHLLLFFEGESYLLSETLYWALNANDKRPATSLNFSFLSTIRDELVENSTLTVFIHFNPKLLPLSTLLPPNIPIFITSTQTPTSESFFNKLKQTLEKFHRGDIDYLMYQLSTTHPQYYKAIIPAVNVSNPKLLFRRPTDK